MNTLNSSALALVGAASRERDAVQRSQVTDPGAALRLSLTVTLHGSVPAGNTYHKIQ